MTILTQAQLNAIIALDPANGSGDRIAAYLLLWQDTGDPEALLQARIASFSGGVGGAAFGANEELQIDLGPAYPGIFVLSEAVFQDSINAINQNLAAINSAQKSLSTVMFGGAQKAWSDAGLAQDFPGNLFAFNPLSSNAMIPSEMFSAGWSRRE
jgi:hypothetical protein